MTRTRKFNLLLAGFSILCLLTFWQISTRSSKELSFNFFEGNFPIPSTDLFEVDMSQNGEVKTDLGINSKVAATKVFFEMKLDGKLELSRHLSSSREHLLFGRLLIEHFSFDFGSKNSEIIQNVRLSLQEPFVVFPDSTYQSIQVRFRNQTNNDPIAQNILIQLIKNMYFNLQTSTASTKKFLNHSEISVVTARAVTSDLIEFKVEPKVWQHNISDFRMEGDGTSTLTVTSKSVNRILEIKTLRKLRTFRGENEIQKEFLDLHVKHLGSSSGEWVHDLETNIEKWSEKDTHLSLETEVELLRKIVGSRTYSQLTNEFLSYASSAKINDMAPWVEQMIAYLKLNPDKIKDFAKLLNELPATDQKFDIVGVILLQTGKQEAQQELIQALKSHCHDERACSLLSESLALYKDLSLKTLVDCIQIFEDLPASEAKSSLLLSLSGMGYQVDESQGKDMVYELIEKALNHEELASNRDSYYLAFGNLGHPKTLKRAEELLGSGNTQDRVNGAIALRRINGDLAPAVDRLLNQISQHDPEVDVRRKVSHILADRSLDTSELETLGAALTQERDVQVALNFVDAIGQRIHSDPKAREILLAYFRTCSHTDICKRVQTYLLK